MLVIYQITNHYRGLFSKALVNCETPPKIDLKSISDGESLPVIDVTELSCDKAFLFNYITATLLLATMGQFGSV